MSHAASPAATPGVEAGPYRTAGTLAIAAAVTTTLSFVAIALFFGGAGAVFGPINDVLVASSLFLLIPAVLAVRRLAAGSAGAWFGWLSLVAVVGMVEAALGQLLLVAGVIDLGTSFVTGGIGFAPLVAWWLAHGVIARRTGVPSRRAGTWILAGLALMVAVVVASVALPVMVMNAIALPMTVAWIGWMVVVGLDLRAIA